VARHRRRADDEHSGEPYQGEIIRRYGVRAVMGKAVWARRPSRR